MDIKQDPNSIPNFNAGGRLGELQPNQPEQSQSSVQLDTTADGDGAASGKESAADPAPKAATPDPTTTGAGAVDGLVGAP